MNKKIMLMLLTSVMVLVYAQSIQDKASHGAITEGIFILKNKQNRLLRYKNILERALKKVSRKHKKYNHDKLYAVKELSHKYKQLNQSPHKPHQRFLKRKVNELEQSLARTLLSQAHILLKESLYPQLLLEITHFSEFVKAAIATLSIEEISEKEIREHVAIADIILDKAILQMELLRLFFEFSTDTLKLMEKERFLVCYEEDYLLLQSKNTKQLLNNLQKSITFLKNSCVYRKKCLKQKEKDIKKCCQDLVQLLSKYSFNTTKIKPNWFITALEALDNKADIAAILI